MNNPNPILKLIKESAGIRLAVFFGSFFVLLIFSSVLSQIVLSIPTESLRIKYLLNSVIQSFFAFIVPSIILAKFCTRDSFKWLGLTKRPSFISIFGVIIVYIISMPAMECLIDWNANIHLPESLASFETILRQWEETGETTTKTILEADNFISVIIGVAVIGVITGFSEELFFRGGFQGILERTAIGKNLSVWMAALVFSTMHFQFFGFIPRLIMGAFFGYLLIWTKSLWVPIFAHILNNSTVVITSAFNDNFINQLSTEKNSFIEGNQYMIITSFILTFLFFFFCRTFVFKRDKSYRQIWQKKQFPSATKN